MYTYDASGNIATKTEYNINNLTNGTVKTYTYGNSVWRDQLTGYTGYGAFVYDTCGNPTTYDGKSLIWEKGRQLKQFGTNTFKYNGEGIRTNKNSTQYILDGRRILFEKTGATTTQYLYGSDGSIIGFKREDDTYYYIKNQQGDIIKVTDVSGIVLTKYVYDAWGNHKVYDANNIENTDSAFIGNINPFRYRSYYYDVETGLYYLNARYYDPKTGRFINADDPLNCDPEDINAFNLYAYCGNNPIMLCDSSGQSPWYEFWNWDWEAIGKTALSVVSIIGGTVLCFVGAAIGYGYNEGWNVGAIIGGAIGLAVAAPQLISLTANITLPTYGWMSTGSSLVFGVTGSVAVAVPVGTIAIGVGALGLIMFAEHTKNKRPSNWDKHSGKRSGGPEKKDPKMKYKKWKRSPKGILFPLLPWLLDWIFGND